MKLSVVIPVFNEEKTLSEILHRVKGAKLPKNLTKEIVVVDDASVDGSLAILRSHEGIKVVRHTKNKGKGAAIKTGFGKASGDIILIQDADLEYNPNDYYKLIGPILAGKTHVVYGTRLKTLPFKLGGKHATPLPFHYLGNKLLTLATNILYGSNLTDMETCYKVMTRKVAKALKIESNRFDVEPEITAKILKKGYTIYEVPIKVKPRTYSEGKKITWLDGIWAIWTLIKYRFSD